MPVEYVKLDNHDLNALIEISQLIVDWKHRNLTAHNWQVFEQDYLPSLVEQLSVNSFKIADPQKNIFVWLQDQILHSRRATPGLRDRECLPLADTHQGERALEILRVAQRGQVSYNSYKHNQKFRDLFDNE